MDGTLTRPLLDFDAIRRDLGITGPILEALRHMEGEQLQQAHRILDEHERLASERSELNEGCSELLQWLAAHQLRTALITRNSRNSTRIILQKHHLRFDAVFTREDDPPKPHPESLLRPIRHIGCNTTDVWMVGDGSHDIEAAEAAGVTSVWISHGAKQAFEAKPTCTLSSLCELLPILERFVNSPQRQVRV